MTRTDLPEARATRARTEIERYDPTEIEPRWQQRWEEMGLHRTDLDDDSRPRYYVLTMYTTRPATCTSATGSSRRRRTRSAATSA